MNGSTHTQQQGKHMQRSITKTSSDWTNEMNSRLLAHGCEHCGLHQRHAGELIADGWQHYAPGFANRFDSAHAHVHCWHQRLSIEPRAPRGINVEFDVWFSVARMVEIDRRYFSGLPSVAWHVLPPGRDATLGADSGHAPGVIACMYELLVPKSGQRSKLELWADSIGRSL